MQAAGKMKALNLSASQKEQLKAARQNTNTQLAALNKNDQMTVKDFKESKAEILKSQKQQMAGILTEDQKINWHKVKLRQMILRVIKQIETLGK